MKPTFLFFPERAEGARISIVGAPYDLNSSRRYGSRYAPHEIRAASLDMEDSFLGKRLDLPVEDTGDVSAENWKILKESLHSRIAEIGEHGSIPLVLGGDHSITPLIIEALGRKDISVVSIDAHLDFDRELYGNTHSHSTPRRIEADIIGGNNIHIIGVRSWPEESMKDALEAGVHVHTMPEIRKKGMEAVLGSLPDGPVYITLDIDGIDPAYAPGTGTPEPFGLTPSDVLEIIERLAKNAVGMDLVEVCPPQDINGVTSTLASRLIAGFMTSFFS